MIFTNENGKQEQFENQIPTFDLSFVKELSTNLCTIILKNSIQYMCYIFPIPDNLSKLSHLTLSKNHFNFIQLIELCGCKSSNYTQVYLQKTFPASLLDFLNYLDYF